MTLSLLDSPIQFLKGVGPSRGEAFQRMGILTARDLLYHVPRRYDDASTVQPISRLEVGMDATAMGRVRSVGVIPTRSGLRIFQAVLEDESGMITCAWPGQPWLDRKIRVGDTLLATGTVRFFHGRQLHPREFVLLEREARKGGKSGDGKGTVGTIFPSYPATEELPQWALRSVFEKNLDSLLQRVQQEEYLEAAQREALGLLPLPKALETLHRPLRMENVEEARRRLAFDELFFLQLVQAMARYRQSLADPGIAFSRTNALIRPLTEALPFQLTTAQIRALREIMNDMTSSRRMNRLLQGDVGSGKTVVALMAMLLAVEGGYQAALMAPTELLAEQHFRTLTGFLEGMQGEGDEVRLHLLTGRMRVSERRPILEAFAQGGGGIAVGTHALIQEGVELPRLGLVVVDEQHRFGVRQRMALVDHPNRPDALVMSATPIPRSMAMALYGDLDLSLLDERPPGRKPVRTHLVAGRQRSRVHEALRKAVERGEQGYLVYPLVEESEKVDLRSATEAFQELRQEVFPDLQVGLLHGQLPGEEKEGIMRSFLEGKIQLLVATTVVEVGIDVSNATQMVIEHPERFGLSQLHQLRGRVGRGGVESHCFLVGDVQGPSRERLKAFSKTEDGFQLARLDLEIRGQGDLFGAQQHGRDPLLSFADLARDEELVILAQRNARAMVDADPHLTDPANETVRALLESRHGERLKMYRVG